jgi:DNA-binding GntR family transcriptional regulator
MIYGDALPETDDNSGLEGGNRRRSLTDQAYMLIRRDIISRSLLPNTTLVEGDLAKRYEMSKTPIREALFALVHSRLVDGAARGWRVRVMNKTDAVEIYRLREVLEPLALRASVPLMTPADRTSLRRSINDAREAIMTRDLARLTNANLRFHSLLFYKASNSRTKEILRHLQDQLQVIRMEIWTSEREYNKGVVDHAAIADAVEAGDATAASMLLHEHIRDYRIQHLTDQ